MKLKNKLMLITIAAMLAFFGVGYAAWTFTNIENAQITTMENKVSIGIELTNNFKLYNAINDEEVEQLYLICDAPAGKEYVLEGNGVYWATDKLGVNMITNVYLKGSLMKEMNDNVHDKTSVIIKFTAKHDLKNNDYVVFGAIKAPANAVIENISTNGVFDVCSPSFALPTVEYSATDENMPHNLMELTAMNNALLIALSGKTLSFTAQIIA